MREGDDKCVQNFSHKTKEENDVEYSSADEKVMLNSSFKWMECEVVQWFSSGPGHDR